MSVLLVMVAVSISVTIPLVAISAPVGMATIKLMSPAMVIE